MGTRCLTVVRSRQGNDPFEVHAVIYRHWDGYPEGHGKWLLDFLDGMHIVNGIGGGMPAKYARGPGRLAAQLVSKLQQEGHEPGLLPGIASCGQEFQYHVDVTMNWGLNGDAGTIEITVFNGPMTAFGLGGDECTNQIFKGTVSEYAEFLSRLAEVD